MSKKGKHYSTPQYLCSTTINFDQTHLNKTLICIEIVLYSYAELQVNDAYTARQTQRDKLSVLTHCHPQNFQ